MAKFLGMGGMGIDHEIRVIAEDIDSPADPGRRDRGLHHLEMIEEKFSEFENDLNLKGKRATYEELFDAYRRAIEVLRDYFDSEGAKVKPRDADIYYFYLVEKHKEFKEIYGESVGE